MTELLSHIDTPSDAELISRVRGGDVAAYGELFSRHVEAANRLARQLVRGPDADDLVSEAFAKVLQVLQGGGGPDVAFRAYLLTSVRRLHVDKVRAGARLQTTDDLTPFDPGIPFQDTAVAGFESGAAAKAFASLPERWQLVLWHLEVEGQKPAEIAPLLGMSANSVSALAYRAREGLRQAFLTMHLSDISDTTCRWVNEHLGAYVRNGLSKRDSVKVRGHLDECRRCTAMYLELTEVNSNLSGIIAPLLLGAAATGYLASTGGAVGTAGLLGALGRARDVVLANTGAATAGAVAAGVAAAAVVGISLTTGNDSTTTTGADKPVQAVSSAPATPGTSPGARRSPSTKPSASAAASAPAPAADPTPLEVPGLLVPQPPGTAAPAPGADAPPGDGTANGPGGEPGSNPGTSPGDNPSGNAGGEPSSGPSDSPSDKPSDKPSSEPSNRPTDDPSSEPSNSPDPGPPNRVQADVSVTAEVGPTSNSVTLKVTGGATLPPALDVALTSDPGGITFTTGGPCDAADTIAHCTLIGGGGGAAQARTNSVPVAADDSAALTLYFDIPEDQQETTVRLSVSVPEGYDDPNLEDNVGVYTYTPAGTTTSPDPSTPPEPLEAPLVMGDLSPQTATPDNDGRYQITAHVGGIPEAVDSLTFVLTGDAAFDSATQDCAIVDEHQVTCPTGGAGSLDPHFVLTGQPGQISITVQVPDDYLDTSSNGGPSGTEDNSAGATLAAKPATPPSADVSVANLRPDQATPEGDGSYALVADVAGFPDGKSPDAHYTLDGQAHVVGTSTPGCTVDPATPPEAAKTITCTDPKDGTLAFQVRPDSGADQTSVTLSVALDGYDDSNQDNNVSGPATLVSMPTADLGLTLPATSAEDGDHDPTVNEFPLAATVTGLPTGVDSLVLTQSGASGFAASEGCTPGNAGVTCTVQPDADGTAVVNPVVTYDGDKPVDVTLTAMTPDGYVDATPAMGTTTLQPEPMDGLTATASLAFPDDHSNPDGLLTVTVSGAAAGHALDLTLEGKNSNAEGMSFTGVVSGPCPTAGDQGATCTSAGTYVFSIHVPQGLLDGQVTVDDHAHAPFTAPFSDPAAETLNLLIPTTAPLHPEAAPSPPEASPPAGANRQAAPLDRVTRHSPTPPSDALPKAVLREAERRPHPQPRSHRHAHHGPPTKHAKAHFHAWKSKHVKAHGHGHGDGHAKSGKHAGHPGVVRLLLGGILGGMGR